MSKIHPVTYCDGFVVIHSMFMVCMFLQNVLSEEFKASEMEVGVVTAKDGFRVLSTEEVDNFLTIISERD